MKLGLWFLSAAAVAGASTLLAAALPLPPGLPSTPAVRAPAPAIQLAAAPGPITPADPARPPAASPPQAAATPHVVPTAAPPLPAAARPKRDTAAATPHMVPPVMSSAPGAARAKRDTAAATPQMVPTVMPSAPGAARPKRITAPAIAEHRLAPKHLAQSPTRHLAEAALDHDRRAAAHSAELHSGAIVPKPPDAFPRVPAREPTHLAMVPPPPYGMPPPYWRPPYPPYPPYSPN